jgi:hypothetical protein
MVLNSVTTSEASFEQPANQSLGTNEFEAQFIHAAKASVKLAQIVPAATMPDGRVVACKDMQSGQYVDCPNGVGQAGNGGSLRQPIMPNQRPVPQIPSYLPNGQQVGVPRGVPAMPDLPNNNLPIPMYGQPYLQPTPQPAPFYPQPSGGGLPPPPPPMVINNPLRIPSSGNPSLIPSNEGNTVYSEPPPPINPFL